MQKDKKMLAYMLSFVFLAIAIGYLMGGFFEISTANIAIIKIDSEMGPDRIGSMSSDNFKSLLESAATNPNVRAIILAINSPGGTVVTSQEITDLVRKSEKPVVAWIRDIGTSGAYWVASASDSIVASPISMTGSLGVTQTYLEFSGLFEKYGITYVNLTYPGGKDIMTPYRGITDQEKEHILDMLNITYWHFISDIARNRNMTLGQLVDVSGNGTILLGSQAFEKGLVDHLGGFDTAVEVASLLGNISHPETEVMRSPNQLNDLLSLFASSTGINLRNDMVLRT